MLYPRLIPVLLVKDKGLVKTVKFKDGKYVGDPLNAVKIFNEKEADELTILDIDASSQNREPDFKLIENVAAECRMPLCYGGGIKTAEQAQTILALGVEKVALSSIVFEDIGILRRLADSVGKQSVVVVLDVKKKLFGSKYDVFTHNGTTKQKVDLIDFIEKLQSEGAGEIVINSIDQDGVMKGYDIDLIEKVKSVCSVPLTVLGGAGSYQDIQNLIGKHPIIGAAAGSTFVFKGKYKAVLINYPNQTQKANIVKQS